MNTQVYTVIPVSWRHQDVWG